MAVSLTYFDGRGLAEVPRLVLAEAGVKFEDRRVKDIATLKAELPFGQVPLYQDGDFKLVQSQAIIRYVARTHNLYGKDAKEAALIDQIGDGIQDLRTHERNAKDVSDSPKSYFVFSLIPLILGCCQGNPCQRDPPQVAGLFRGDSEAQPWRPRLPRWRSGIFEHFGTSILCTNVLISSDLRCRGLTLLCTTTWTSRTPHTAA